MSKEKQIEEIKDHTDSIYGCDCAYYGVDGIGIATVLYEAGYRKQEWISVDERLPENDTTVLCYNGVINTYTYEEKNKWWADSCWDTTKGFGITHWMPLPEPPKMN